MNAPKVKMLVTIISVPMRQNIILFKDQSIGDVEEYFTSLRDQTIIHDRKVEFDRVRALLKWTACCNGSLIDMNATEHNLEIALGFGYRDDLIAFLNSLEENVNGAMIH